MKLPVEINRIEYIVSKFCVEPKEITDFHDTSRGEKDIRWNLFFGEEYVLKINAEDGIGEERLQEISRLIGRYNSIGVYCPGYIPTKSGALSFPWENDGRTYICYMEEFAKYPVLGDGVEGICRKAIVEHLGLLSARFTNVDLSATRSMWSIIDLAPLDLEIDEKQENANELITALRETGFPDLAAHVDAMNRNLRHTILPDFRDLPRCVFQGDLNSTNVLHDNGRFVGLIDFNCSGTDVNINVFLNETSWFPSEDDFEKMNVSEMIENMNSIQNEISAPIYEHYTLNALETRLYPYFKRIVDLFQFPNVRAMIYWLKNEHHREKCVNFIENLIEAPLQKAPFNKSGR